MSTEGKKSLVTKLAEVMGEVERIPKSGRNDFHRYDYATEADIVAAVRKGMAARALMLMPSVERTEWRKVPAKNGEQTICTLTVRFTVLDGESGEKLEFTVLGEGQDQGDKATYKALTGATKYALLKLFLIPTGDDPEKDDDHARHPPPRSAPRNETAKVASGRSESKAAHLPTSGPKVPASPDPEASRRAARARRIWDAAKAQGYDGDRFGKFVAGELGAQKQSVAWTDGDMDKLEYALTQVTQAQA